MYYVYDIGWLYDKSTGIIPYIINNNNTIVKNIADNTLIEMLNKNAYPDDNAKETIIKYYNIPDAKSYSSHQLITDYLSILEWVTIFKGKPASNVMLSSFKVKLMKHFVDKRLHKTYRKEEKLLKKREMQEHSRKDGRDF